MELTEELLEKACSYHFNKWSLYNEQEKSDHKTELRKLFESGSKLNNPGVAFLDGAHAVTSQGCDLAKVKHLVYAASLAQGHSPSAYWAEVQVNEFGDISVVIKRKLGDEKDPKDVFVGRSRKNLNECYLQIRYKIENWHAVTTNSIADNLDKCVKKGFKDTSNQ